VKLIQAEKGKLVFHLGKREEHLLRAVLRHYPLIPAAHQPLSKSIKTTANKADQRLLDEALAEQRKDNQRLLEKLLNDPQRFKETEAGCRLTLSGADVEWLLQVLNDVRIGSWIALGSPDKDLGELEWNEETAPQILAMEMSGNFQMTLLEALQRPGAT